MAQGSLRHERCLEGVVVVVEAQGSAVAPWPAEEATRVGRGALARDQLRPEGRGDASWHPRGEPPTNFPEAGEAAVVAFGWCWLVMVVGEPGAQVEVPGAQAEAPDVQAEAGGREEAHSLPDRPSCDH